MDILLIVSWIPKAMIDETMGGYIVVRHILERWRQDRTYTFYNKIFFFSKLQINLHSSPLMAMEHVCALFDYFIYILHLSFSRRVSLNHHRTKWPSFRRRYFQMHFLEWKFCILIQTSPKFVPKGPIDNNPALV